MDKLDCILENANNTQKMIDGKWVAARPEPLYGLDGLWWRLKDAWQVLTGKADAFTWPEGQ